MAFFWHSSFILSMSKQLHRVDHSFNRKLLGKKNVRKSVSFSPFFCRRADADNRVIEKAMRLRGQLDKAIDRRWACNGEKSKKGLLQVPGGCGVEEVGRIR